MSFRKTKNRALDNYLHSLIAQGNHLAYLRLKKRYEKYSRIICKQALERNLDSGVTLADLFAVCSACFKEIILKYNPQKLPFYSFWKDVATQEINDYFLINSYNAKARTFNGIINLDEENDEKKLNLELIRETDEDYIREKNRRDALRIIDLNTTSFSHKELVVLHYILDGYTIKELEHGDLMSRSMLYLTYNNAIKKLRKIILSLKLN